VRRGRAPRLRASSASNAPGAQAAPWHAHSKAAQRCLAELRVADVCEGGACEPPFPALGGGAQAERACGVDSARALVFQARAAGRAGKGAPPPRTRGRAWLEERPHSPAQAHARRAAQVGKLGRRYQEWLGAPCLASEPLRMFDSHFLEGASKTPWWTVPLLWLPLALFSLWAALVRHATPAAAAAAHACGGLLAWSLVEYALHRFVFHARPTSYWGITLHFSFHGCHHKHPSDRLRLVFPPLFAAPLVAGFRFAIAAALPVGRAAPFFAGMLSGYVAYDCMHYFSHHAARPPRWLARSRKAHLEHHFVDSTHGFGVSGDLFDRVFGTLPKGRPGPAWRGVRA